MKKFAFVLIILLALALSAAAADTLILPDDLTTIGEDAFYGTDAVTIVLPEGVTAIGDRAFGGSASLRTVYVPDSLMDREQAALAGSANARFVSLSHDWSAEYDYTVGDDSVTIKKYKGTDTEVSIPAAIDGKPVTVIGNSAFKNNGTITSVVIPEGVTELQTDAFHSCFTLTDVTFPQSLRTIGSNAFQYCGRDAETSFAWRLPDNLTELAGIANNNNFSFNECNAVKVVTPDSATARLLSTANGAVRGWFTYPGEEDFRYAFYRSEEGGPYDTLHLMKYIGTDAEVEIPDHGTASTRIGVIHNNAFKGNGTLTGVVIPEGVTDIGVDAFHTCFLLTDVTFPQSLRTIDSNAFQYCGRDAETSFAWRLPDNLTELAGIANNNNFSFNECNAVKVVTPDSATARLLSTANGAVRGWFTYPGEEDFRYAFYRSEEGGPYDTLHLMKYIGTDAEVEIPDHGTASTRIGVIHRDAFKGNETLTGVVIPEGVTDIETDAFHTCFLLKDVTFPQSLRSLGHNAFIYCGRDVADNFYFILPDGITEMGENPFSFSNVRVCCNRYISSESPDLTSTYQLLGDKWWGWADGPFRMADYHVLYTHINSAGEQHTEQILRIKLGGYVPEEGTDWDQPVTIPRSVYRIDDDCFKNLSELRSLIMPDYGTDLEENGIGLSLSVQEIGQRAFMGCSNLTSIRFPEAALGHIEVGAFSGCGNNAAPDSYTFEFKLHESDSFRAGMTEDGLHVADCNAKFLIRWIEAPPILN